MSDPQVQIKLTGDTVQNPSAADEIWIRDLQQRNNELRAKNAELIDAKDAEIATLRKALDEAQKNLANTHLDLQWPIVKERNKLKAEVITLSKSLAKYSAKTAEDGAVTKFADKLKERE